MPDDRFTGREIFELKRQIEELETELKRVTHAMFEEEAEIDQILGRALGYVMDTTDIGGHPDSVETGEHVPVTLAMEAARKIKTLQHLLKRNQYSQCDHSHEVFCYECGMGESEGHTEICPIALALKPAVLETKE